MIKPRFLPAAEAEFLKEIGYYSQAREGTGVKFQAAVGEVVEQATRNPQGGAAGPTGTRTRMVKGFPFSIVYRASDAELLVVALAHHRRKPSYWAARLV